MRYTSDGFLPQNSQALPVPQETRHQSRPGIHLLLFLLTLFTTLYAGALWEVPEEYYVNEIPAISSESGRTGSIYWYAITHLYLGIPFSFTLLAILGAHEMGHYYMCRRHNMNASLPYFLPVPPIYGIGTIGAFIRIRSAIPDKKALFDVGVAGPIAGMIVAIPAMFIGIYYSEIHYRWAEGSVIELGEPLLLKAITYLMYGPLPSKMDVTISPMAFAAWLGFFVTFLNLIPIGQLDGGHITYALIGKHHTRLGFLMVVALVSFGVIFQSLHWLIWAIVILVLLGVRHPQPRDMRVKLDFKRKLVAILALLILIGTFVHNPLSFQEHEEVTSEEILQQSI